MCDIARQMNKRQGLAWFVSARDWSMGVVEVCGASTNQLEAGQRLGWVEAAST